MTGPAVRVFLADDHEIVRRGLVALIDAQDDLEVVGEAATAAQARGRILAVRPDVAVLDVRLPDGSGIDVCRQVKQDDPGIRCLMLTAYDDEDALRSALIAGADGYVIKDIRGSSLLDDIRAAASGKKLIDPRIASRVTAQLREPADDPRFASLGLRERQVLALIADGFTNRQIGERLGLAEKTVKNYVSSLLAKLGLERRTQAAVLQLEHRRSDH
jgi:DNA-binding NarL/FixJ family response regulator